jgi:cytochrome b561
MRRQGTPTPAEELHGRNAAPGVTMTIRAAPRGYSILQITLHWTIAALVVFQLAVNEEMQDAFKDKIDGRPGDDEIGVTLHMIVGLTIFGLALVRLAVRLWRGAPESQATNPRLVNIAGQAAHILLYGFLFVMPLTGAIAWFTGLELSAELHELGRFILIPLIVAHALGALAEHFVFRTNSLVRMLKAEPPSQ